MCTDKTFVIKGENMSLRYKIIESKKFVYVTGVGEITNADLFNHLDELSKDARYITPMKKLVDYRQATPMGPPQKDIYSFANEMTRLKDVFVGEKCAIVVNDDLSFGTSRVYMAVSEAQEMIQTNVFRDINAALHWLDIQFDDTEISDA